MAKKRPKGAPAAFGKGAARRRKMTPAKRIPAVIKSFEKGTLHSGSGKIVKSRKQAIAIAMSEAGKSRKGKKKK